MFGLEFLEVCMPTTTPARRMIPRMKFWNAGAAAICWQTFTISAEPKDTEQGVGGNGGLFSAGYVFTVV